MTAKTAQRTPGPWTRDGERSNKLHFNGKLVAVFSPDTHAESALILRACNSHDDLLAALRGAESTLEGIEEYSPGSFGVGSRLVMIRAAVARAEK